jgi:hypothetical protein
MSARQAIFLTLILQLMSSGIASADDATSRKEEIAKVQADVRQLLTAVDKRDFDTVLKFTDPTSVAAMGGPDAAKELMAKALQNGKVQPGDGTEKLEFVVAPTFATGKEHEFVLVPYKAIYRRGKQRVETDTFSLGAREIGSKNWYYHDSAGIKETIRILYRDFPASLVLPKTTSKPIE